ncbi:MAG: alpha-D-ribose 1-methylphosphonate 5-triphosphate diphosphatase [Pseudomonadota bacterium]
MRDMAVREEEVILANAKLVLEDRISTGSVRIKHGVIVSVDEGSTTVPGALDCEGDYLAPGLIELHTDNLERHMQPRPGVKWPKNSALIAHDAELASVGITTVFDAMRIGSIVSDSKSRYGKYAREASRVMLDLRAAGVLRISHFLHLRAEACSETLEEEFAEFGPDDRVGLVSLMDHTPGQRQFRNETQLRAYLSGKYAMGEAQIDAHLANQRKIGAQFGPGHKALAVRRATELGAILASHDDTAEAHVVESANHGVRLAEFPTTIEAAKACRAHGIAVMMGAPNVVRGGSHSGNVSAMELAEMGLLDILSSDYVPGSLLSAGVALGEAWGDLARGIATVTAAPAAAAALEDRGRLMPGLRADMVRFRLIDGVPVTSGSWVKGARVA